MEIKFFSDVFLFYHSIHVDFNLLIAMLCLNVYLYMCLFMNLVVDLIVRHGVYIDYTARLCKINKNTTITLG